MNTKKNSTKIFYYLLFALVLVLVIFAFLDTDSNKKRITYQEATQYFAENKIDSWHVMGTSKIVFKVTDSTITDEEFPKKYDFYMAYDKQAYDDWYETQNATYDGYEPPAGSIWDTLYPIIMIVLALIFIFFMFKMFSSKGNGAMGFGKSRARSISNISVKFNDIAGADEEKNELQEIVEFLKSPEKFRELGARIPKGVLLVGPPGTGKTLLARAVAGESGVPFLSISGSDFVEMFVGVGASRVRDLFDQAKKSSPCIIFIDEIDAVGRQRGAGLGGSNDEREQTLNQLLVELDGFEANQGIIVLAATNRADVLDPALLRPGRFDRQVYVNPPDVKGREGILKIHAKNKPLDKSIDFKTLARITSGFTGADIENMLNEAAILAARAGRKKIIMVDITEGINKAMMGPQKRSTLVTDNDKQITAYHESGHAILGKILQYGDEIQEVSIIPRGQALGYTSSRPVNDDLHMRYNKLNDMIADFMGGRIAEEIVFGDVSVGASNDIMRATNLARKMVTEWGMSKKFGFMSFGSEGQVFIGRDYQQKNAYSEKIAGEIDEEVRDILNKNYARAKKILTDNLSLLTEMANLLIARETIYKEEVDMLMEGKTAVEIIEIMEIKDKKQQEELEKERVLNEKQKKLEEIELKLKTGEVFLKHGIITEQEFDQLKKLRDDIKREQKLEDEKTTTEDKEEETEVKVEDKLTTEPKVEEKTKNKVEEKVEKKTNKADKGDKK